MMWRRCDVLEDWACSGLKVRECWSLLLKFRSFHFFKLSFRTFQHFDISLVDCWSASLFWVMQEAVFHQSELGNPPTLTPSDSLPFNKHFRKCGACSDLLTEHKLKGPFGLCVLKWTVCSVVLLTFRNSLLSEQQVPPPSPPCEMTHFCQSSDALLGWVRQVQMST